MINFSLDRELCDYNSSVKRFKGKILTEDDYDKVISDENDFSVNGPINLLTQERRILAVVIKDVYTDKNNIYNILKDIKLTSDLRTTQSGPVDKDKLEAKGLIEGENYRLINDNSYIRKSKSGEWQDVERGNEIHSGMIGYKRNRWTGENTITPWCDSNPDLWGQLGEIAFLNQTHFEKCLPSTFEYQKSWVDEFIDSKDRIGELGFNSIFTTYSINKYHKDYLVNGMGAHVDPGDVTGGMTTMAVFGEGEVEGAYLVFPRWRTAIKREPGDLVIADSKEVHGVTAITDGEGSMITCVAYSDSRLKKR